ncbi:MAG: aspartate--tRNA(Asn) ligase [Candidatus Nanoarchaeia archaeon]|nr:aspartate--tRNA(Asn) ligase [Candidatus Nanoarchaeia archaeon]MDD5239425.1 aspartate--tRNA(Asn) ligase [Candidatus Nanoarchaeia archaeon]
MYITESLHKEGGVTLRGWVQELRDLKKIKFIILRDKTGTIQAILKDEPEELSKAFASLGKEDYIEITGTLVNSMQAKLGKELVPNKIKIISKCEQPFPLDISGKIQNNPDTEIDWRFLQMRNPKVLKIFELQSEILRSMSSFLRKNGFTRINSSKLVGAATEGGTDYFELKYFDKKAYLAQSPQFYKEMALLSGLDRVFETGMVYRAEPHHTPRHICEYLSFDFEMVCDKLEHVLKMEEKMLKNLFISLNKNCSGCLSEYGITLEFPKKIPRVKFDAAKRIVEAMGVPTEEGDLTPAGEKALCEWAAKEKKSDFVFLTHFPYKHKVFYSKKAGKAALAFDLLYKGLEITSGGLREENYEKRKAQMIEKGLNPDGFDHLRFFKYGMPPHAGLGLGIERLTMQILGLKNVREATLTPRDPTRLTP